MLKANLELEGMKELEDYIISLENKNKSLKGTIKKINKTSENRHRQIKIQDDLITKLKNRNKELLEINEEHRKLNGELRAENNKLREKIKENISNEFGSGINEH